VNLNEIATVYIHHQNKKSVSRTLRWEQKRAGHFTGMSGTGLKRSFRMPMAKQCVPNISKNYRISTPAPDILYGYKDVCFKKQASQMVLLGKQPAANTPGALFPFLVVEFKGDGPSGGGTFWECTNQCLGELRAA
jgi:hypothetical protein